MSRFRKTFYKPLVSTFASLTVISMLSACGGSPGSFSTLPSLTNDDAGRSDDWRISPHLWSGRHRPHSGDHYETPTPAPSDSPSADPSASAAPTGVPSATVPTPPPSSAPSPTSAPTATVPTQNPTTVPTQQPSVAPTSAPTARPTATPTARPTATPTVSPTATPKPGTVLPYDPPAGTFPFFPTSVWSQRIPANPTVNPNTAAWLATLGTTTITPISFMGNASGTKKDYNFPIYPMNANAPGAVAVKVHCTETYGTCNVEGQTVYVDLREIPEDGGTVGEDSHFGLVDTVGGREYDFWHTQWPPVNGTLTIGWGGSCSLSGTGYPGCASTASGTPLTEGVVRANDIMNAIESPTGSLPYAISVSVKCSNGYIAPMTGGDGHTSGCAPQGSRAYLAMHDAQVDALNLPPISLAILRTIDEDHYGLILTDTDGGEDGFSMQCEADFTYTVFGQPGPMVSRLLPEAIAEGIPGTGLSGGVYSIAFPTGAANLASNIKFL